MMSISSQGGRQRRPSVVATGKKARPGGKPADEAATSSAPESSPAEDSPADGSPAGGSSPAAGASGTRTASKAAGSKAAGAKAAGAKTPAAKAAPSKAAGGKTGAGSGKGGAAGRAGAGAGKGGLATGKGAAASGKGGLATGKGGVATGKGGAVTGKGGAGARPGTKGGTRRPITPVKVSQGRSWGPIALFTVVGLLAAGIIGWGAWAVYQNGRSWEDKANGINGIADYRKTDASMLTRNHKAGQLQYKVSPPVGGDHNPTWQRCMGDVYDAQIPSENAVHSLEHGAVWITYRPDLPKDQVDKLAGKVRGKDYLLMSPFPGLDKPISLQAWGYQLKVNNASDGRIDDFISALRQNASMEPGAVCSAGNYTTGTGTTPRDLSDQQNPNNGMPGSGG
jgi:hypothetical protein